MRDEALVRLFALLKEKDLYALTRERVVKVLLEIEGHDAREKVLFLLKDKQDGNVVRQQVARVLITLGQYSFVLPYLYLIEEYEARFYREEAIGKEPFGGISGELIWKIASLRAFTKLLKQESTKNAIHRTLWTASQREKVRILMFKCGPIKLVRVVKR